ncbi:MAG: bifunctional biotin--[acetyl-CoA-carboxylase] ligase/biotin operon repressor BirA [Gammaproteobacteria bacterium]
MKLQRKLLEILSDGCFHSGQQLGESLGVSRSAIWKQIKNFTEQNVEVHAVRGKGYRLAKPIELLDQSKILGFMDSAAHPLLGKLEIHQVIDSTNRYLMLKANTGMPSGYACFAESQQAGKGRQGRPWVSPYARNIYVSLLWRFALGPEALSGLSLVTGIAVMHTLDQLGATGIGLKWPNDVVWNDAKLAGILLEVVGETNGACAVVIGIGLNIDMSEREGVRIDQSWTDLNTVLRTTVSRNRVAGLLLSNLLLVLSDFERNGVEKYLPQWGERDAYRRKKVSVNVAGKILTGISQGIDAQGALLLECNGNLHSILSGEVSLRSAEKS